MESFMRKLSIFAVAGALLALAGCSSAPSPSAVLEEPLELNVKPLAERQAAPKFELKDANGKTVTPEEYKGRVLLLNFWATWCVPCKAEIPWFQEFDTKLKDKGFAVLGVSLDEEGWGTVKPYIEERKIAYRMVIGNEEVSTRYGGIDSLPTTFIIDREGKIAAIHSGLVSKATYQKEIEGLLEGTKNAASNSAGELAMFRGPDFRTK
jgi:cytochrome c biogenesis protein CcmG/thiol:disulfide interchange protein DsbE